jgi:hypothetical protein
MGHRARRDRDAADGLWRIADDDMDQRGELHQGALVTGEMEGGGVMPGGIAFAAAWSA